MKAQQPILTRLADGDIIEALTTITIGMPIWGLLWIMLLATHSRTYGLNTTIGTTKESPDLCKH